MVEQILFSPKTKQAVIIGNKLAHVSYLKSSRTTSDLGNWRISKKSESFINLLPST